ncbi:hypothetical protein NDU88_001663 [Pleurodeles waltl]|uniref:Uncharacterized protein n=1 Tax=Pleurodeles waltl TaxID=8319 RepID=A0AAV7S8M5_PLEWA|nr:hypothetical protein NDU88_001663 [Pleurodeles waltl]
MQLLKEAGAWTCWFKEVPAASAQHIKRRAEWQPLWRRALHHEGAGAGGPRRLSTEKSPNDYVENPVQVQKCGAPRWYGRRFTDMLWVAERQHMPFHPMTS